MLKIHAKIGLNKKSRIAFETAILMRIKDKTEMHILEIISNALISS